MTQRRHHSTNTEFEARIGYDRAVRIGDLRLLSDPTAGTRILATTPQPA